MNYKNYFDSWSPIFDDNSKPLVGKIEFCEANTTNPALKEVYDIDGNPIANPVYCNAVPSTQIMLGEGDYTIRYYRYIGSGNMEDDDNETNWYLYKTELLKGSDLSSDETEEVTIVNTIAELKNISGMIKGTKVIVLGYNEAGDCPSRIYTWIANTSITEDGGVKINSLKDDTGYWLMSVPGSYIDVRWYNDFPDKSANPTTQISNLGQRALAATAANDLHKDLYFPNNYGRSNAFYIFDGSNTVAVTKDIICDNGVRFIVKTGTVGTKVQCHELKKCDRYLFAAPSTSTSIGEYALICDWINASWFSSATASATGAKVGYILDELNGPLSFSDTNIKVENTPIYKVTFDNCNIDDCNHMLENEVIMNNMTIVTDWFAEDYNWSNLTLTNSEVKLSNCSDANTYIILKNKLGETDYGDIGEQEVDVTLGTGNVILENGSGTITIDANGSTNLELHNFSGTVKKSSETYAAVTFNAVDCWLTIDSTITVIDELALRRGNITGTNSLQVLTSCHIEDADISIPLVLSGITMPEIIRCNINSQITMTNGRLQYNQVYAQIKSLPNGKDFVFDLEYNVFHEGGQHYIGVDDATSESENEYTINGTWIHNSALYDTEHWVKIRRYGLTSTNSNFDYRYNYDPYFNKKNSESITFYGITISETSRDRIRTDIPLIMIDKRTSRISIANFKVYAFGGPSLYLGGYRIRMWSNNDYQGETDVGQSGSVQRNFLILDNVTYSLPSTMTTSDEFMTYEYTSNSLSTEEYSYANGTYVGETANNDLDYFTDSLSVWQQNNSEGLPMARVGIKFIIDQNV